MQNLAILLVLLLTTVEARKFTTSNGGTVFKVDLIHRDSPHSPYYNSSMTLKERLKISPLGYISRSHNIVLSSKYYNLSDAELFDIVPNRGAYIIKLGVGTPKAEFFVTADTGSTLIWVQCLPCEQCTSRISQPFDPKESSTFQAIPCNTQACTRSDLTSGCPLEETTEPSACNYQVTYGSGSTSGILATETISLPSSDASPLSLSSCVFGCGIQQSDIPQDGIVGLGIGPSSLISQLSQNIDSKFSYCLPPLASQVAGKLAFGADVTGPGVVSTPFANGPDSTKYYLTLNSISIGDGDISVPSDMNLIIIDSGTTLTFLPTTVYGSIKTALEAAIGLTPTPSPLQTFDLCYSSEVSPPDMVFRFQGADVVLRKVNMFVEIGNGVICLAMVASEDFYIFGNVAQINYQVGYDLEAKQVSFAPANCANY